MIFLFFKNNRFLIILGPPGNHTFRSIRDLWLKGVSLILAYFYTFFEFMRFGGLFPFLKKPGFEVFLVHPSMASVLLSALVERCFVSRMWDFLTKGNFFHTFYDIWVIVGDFGFILFLAPLITDPPRTSLLIFFEKKREEKNLN